SSGERQNHDSTPTSSQFSSSNLHDRHSPDLPKFVFALLFILPLHPLSTLLPYTTLFRSLAVSTDGRPEHLLQPSYSRNSQESRQDRKSTRLNSSHGSISYAVFCLIKKNRSREMLEVHNKNEPDPAPSPTKLQIFVRRLDF